jgi:non-ribosomal peptide synthetase component F
MVTMFEVTLEETQRSQISISFPVGETEIILTDENAQPIWESGISGEICIEGPGKSIGYLNKPDENAERFIELPKGDDNSRVQVYRTGDIGQWRKDLPGCLDFLGRQDTQVKHQSFRIELEEIERVLQTNESVKYAVVVKLNQLKAATLLYGSQ